MDVISYGKARQAAQKADSVQEQLNQAISDGDQLAEVGQAQVDLDGVNHHNLKVRLDSDVQKLRQKDNDLTAQLAEKAQEIQNIHTELPGKVDKDELDDEVTQLTIQINQKVTKGQISNTDFDISADEKKIGLNNLNDEARQAIIGGAPVFPGIPSNSIVEEYLAHGAVSLAKLSDKVVERINKVEKITVLGKNKFEGEFFQNATINGGIGEGTSKLLPSTGGYVAVVKVEPNTIYAVSKAPGTDRFRISTHNEYPRIGDTLLRHRYTSDAASSATITTNNDENYLLIYVSSPAQNLKPLWMQVEKGNAVTVYEPPDYTIRKDKLPSEVNDELAKTSEVREIVSNITKLGKNKFEDKYFRNAVITGGIPGSSLAARTGGYVALVEVEPGETYTISKAPGTDRFRISAHDVYPSVGTSLLRHKLTSDSLTKATLTANNDERFFLIFVSSEAQNLKPDWLQVEEGGTATTYEPTTKALNVKRTDLPSVDFVVTDDFRGVYESDSPFIEDNSTSLSILYAMYDDSVTNHADYVERTLLGNEVSGLPVYMYKFSPPKPRLHTDFRQPKIVYVSGIHGHERRSAYAGALFFKELCEKWKEKDLLRMLRWNVQFIVVPALNPYGFTNYQRKNANGVDLNRNFSTGWSYEPDTSSNNYAGESPLSELETQYMDALMEQNKDAIFAIDHHNFGALSSYAVWLGSGDDKTKRMLGAFGQQMSGILKARHEYIPQDNTCLTQLTNASDATTTRQWSTKGVPCTLLETCTDIGVAEDNQRYAVDVLGNLILAAVRNYEAIRN